MLLLGVCAVGAFSQTEASRPYRVEVETMLNVRAKPAMNAPVLGTLANGTEIEVYGVTGGWARIEYGGREGYVSRNYISPLTEGPVQPSRSPATGGKFMRIVDSIGAFRIDTAMPSGNPMLKLILAISVLALAAVGFVWQKIYDRVENGEYWKRAHFFPNPLLWMLNPLIRGLSWWGRGHKKTLLAFGSILFCSICALEIWHFNFEAAGNWYCVPDEVGWGWTVANFIMFAGVVLIQIMMFFSVAAGVMERSRYFPYKFGIWSAIACTVLLLVALHNFEHLSGWAFVLLAVTQFVQIVMIFRANRRRPLVAIGVVAIYILGVWALMVTLIHFVMLLVIVLIGFLVLAFLGAGDDRKSRECESYDNGYCWYYKRAASCNGCTKFR